MQMVVRSLFNIGGAGAVEYGSDDTGATVNSPSRTLRLRLAESKEQTLPTINPVVLFVHHFIPILLWCLWSRGSTRAFGIGVVLLAVQNDRVSVLHTHLATSAVQTSNASVYGNLQMSMPHSNSPPPSPRQESTNGIARYVELNDASPISSELNEATIVHLSRAVLTRYNDHLSLMTLTSQQSFIYFIFQLLHNNRYSQDPTLQLALQELPFNTKWRQQQARQEQQPVTNTNGHDEHQHADGQADGHDDDGMNDRVSDYAVTSALMNTFVVGLTYTLTFAATKELSIHTLRALHCRAVEMLAPDVLLQTTILLEAIDE